MKRHSAKSRCVITPNKPRSASYWLWSNSRGLVLEWLGWVALWALGVAVIVSPLVVRAAQTQPVAHLKDVRIHQAPDSTRLVLDSDIALAYELKGIARRTASGARIKSDKLRIELPELNAASFDLDGVNLSGTNIGRAYFTGRAVPTLMLDLLGAVRVQAFQLEPVAPYGHRLVVDLFNQPNSPAVALPAAPTTDDRDVVVAIDAGHGGEDPGAVGEGNVLEANVVLQLAQGVATHIDKRRGMRAVLVRDGDYYVPRRGRLAKARAVRADLFVSIHADAFKDSSVSGASVFALSSGAASSELAAWLAAKESRSDLIGGVASDVRLSDKDETLARVLLDLSLDAQIDSSLKLADAVLAALKPAVKLHREVVDQAGFVVLKAPDIPSVLVETGFLSNPVEAKRLAQKGYQRKLTKAIASGIISFIRHYPPAGSYYAKASERALVPRDTTRRHIVSRGETLSTLAEQYGVSTAQLRRFNDLPDNEIRSGQMLIVPEAPKR